MESENVHSKVKLALAVLTSPGAAFEEITRRRLLGSALTIVALTGGIAALPPLIAWQNGGRLELMMLGKCNPVAWLGLCMLYAFAMQKLLKWIGSSVEYVPLLTLMGWSQIALLLSEALRTTIDFGLFGAGRALALQVGTSGAFVLSLWYVALMGPVVGSLCGAPKARGIMTYIVIELAAVIGFTLTYGNTRISVFQNALPGVMSTAGSVAYVDQTPWLGAAVLGLAIGVFQIGRHLGWTHSRARLNGVAAGVLGLAVFVAYTSALSQADYYGKLMRTQVSYNNGNYKAAAEDLEGLLSLSKDNVSLMLDTANVLHLAGNDKGSLDYCRRAGEIVNRQEGQGRNQWLARIHDQSGTALDAQGQSAQALSEFTQAAKQWPEFREPPIRMAVTYDRMGRYDEAIKAGNRAVLKLGSKSPIVWVALLEAFANNGDTKQAKAAMVNLAAKDENLAKLIGPKLDDWKSAVGKLSRKDLKFPLENEMAPKPEKPEKAKKR